MYLSRPEVRSGGIDQRSDLEVSISGHLTTIISLLTYYTIHYTSTSMSTSGTACIHKDVRQIEQQVVQMVWLSGYLGYLVILISMISRYLDTWCITPEVTMVSTSRGYCVLLYTTQVCYAYSTAGYPQVVWICSQTQQWLAMLTVGSSQLLLQVCSHLPTVTNSDHYISLDASIHPSTNTTLCISASYTSKHTMLLLVSLLVTPQYNRYRCVHSYAKTW